MRRVAIVLAVFGIALCVLAPVQAGADPVPGPVVHTDAGDVGSIVNGSVVEWRAVPYAAPPVGNLRWRPPAPAEPWAGVRQSPDFAPQCLQLISDTQAEGSEDCLYLNVFAPVGTTPSDGLPVMVHLHGGGNLGFRPYRNAGAFVERGVIVVTVGYRLGAFGFVGHPELTNEGDGSSGEYGVLDQIAALHWVQDNITGFGGDPDNVTLFGESAGSVDTVAIAASPLGEGLFARVAAQSGYFHALHGIGTIADAESLGSNLAEAVGCSDLPDVVGCLRAVPAEDIVVGAGFLGLVNGHSPWVGGRVLSKSPLELIGSDATPVPMLVGSTREEAAFVAAIDGVLPPGDNYPAEGRARDTNWVAGPQNGRHVRDLYPVGSYESAFWASVAFVSDAEYTCPMRSLALANKAPVYRYLYTHVYDTVPDPVIIAAKASHFFDEPILWHDPGLLYGLDFEFSADEELLADRMAAYWTNFAKTGNPNGPEVETWLPFTSGVENIKVLDEPGGDLVGYHKTECAFWERVPYIFAPASWYTPLAVGR